MWWFFISISTLCICTITIFIIHYYYYHYVHNVSFIGGLGITHFNLVNKLSFCPCFLSFLSFCLSQFFVTVLHVGLTIFPTKMGSMSSAFRLLRFCLSMYTIVKAKGLSHLKWSKGSGLMMPRSGTLTLTTVAAAASVPSSSTLTKAFWMTLEM